MTARQSSSALLVPTTPTNPNHAASKSYVDTSISSATSGINVAMDHVTGLVTALGGKMDKSVIDAKGEIVAGTAPNTPGIVTAPGSDGLVLKSASAQATGMGWAALAAADVGLGNVNNTSDAVKNVATAATLTTPRAINGVNFDGSAPITINAVDATAREAAIAAGTSAQYWRGDKTWQALTQDAVPDGTTNKAYSATDKTRLANTSGTNTGDQTSVTGNAGTATKLATARAINGVNFDGTAAITINAVDATAREPAIAAGTTAQYWRGDKSWQAISSLAAGTAATLATPRAINGVNFDGSAAITINAVDATAREPAIAAGTTAQYWRGDKSWQALTAAAVGLGNVDNTSDVTKNAAAVALTNKDLTSATNTFPTLNQNTTGTAAGITGKTTPAGAIVGTTDSQPLTNKDLTGAGNTFPTFNQSTSGNAATATKLATARNINGTLFDGSADVVIGESVTTSSAASLTLTVGFSAYVFTGASPTTWTLPAVAGNTNKRLTVENRGSASITLQRAGTDQIWFLSGLTAVTIAPGGSLVLINDGTYWNSLSIDVAHNSVGILPVANGGTGQANLTGLPLVSPALSGTATGTYTLGGTPTISAPTITTPTITGYTETVQALGTVAASKTIPALSGGTVMTCQLTAATTTTFTMPTAVAGQSFVLAVQQAATPTGLATFTGVIWPGGTAPTVTATASYFDIFTFFCFDGAHWRGSVSQGYSA